MESDRKDQYLSTKLLESQKMNDRLHQLKSSIGQTSMTGLKVANGQRPGKSQLSVSPGKSVSPMKKSSTARKLVGVAKSPVKSAMKSQKSLRSVKINEKKKEEPENLPQQRENQSGYRERDYDHSQQQNGYNQYPP